MYDDVTTRLPARHRARSQAPGALRLLLALVATASCWAAPAAATAAHDLQAPAVAPESDTPPAAPSCPLGAEHPSPTSVDSAASTSQPKAPPAVRDKLTFGVQPSSASGPDPRPYFFFGLTPGAYIEDHVTLLNYSLQPLTVQLYATDALNGADGAFGLLAEATKPTDVGSWARLCNPRSVTVPQRSRVTFPLSIQVPVNASPGDHVGAVVASLTTYAKNAQGTTVKVLQRVGTRIYARVSGPVRPELTITGITTRYHERVSPIAVGGTTVRYTVKNTGNVLLGGRQAVRVSSLFGGANARNLPELPQLLPGASATVTAHVPSVFPVARLTTKISIDPLIVPGQVDPGLHVYTGSKASWALPYSPLVLILLLVVGGILWRRRQRARKLLNRPPAPVRATSGAAA